MKFSYLLSEILGGSWAIEPQTALAHGQLVANLLLGADEYFEERKPWSFQFGGGAWTSGSNYNDAPAGSVAIIPVKGTMLKYGTLCSYGTTEIASKMQDAMLSKKISAIVLDIDSGGGAVNSISPLMQVIAGKSKPIVALADMDGSAAYWISSACDYVMAENRLSSCFGSIGVVNSFADFQPMYEREGVKFHTIYAPESKDKNQAFEKALKGDYELMQSEILSPLAIQFQNHVKQSRQKKLKAETPGLLSGKMFFAEDALKAGLIDGIGNMQQAIQKALDLAEVQKFMKS